MVVVMFVFELNNTLRELVWNSCSLWESPLTIIGNFCTKQFSVTIQNYRAGWITKQL
jgi:hypothetical protein